MGQWNGNRCRCMFPELSALATSPGLILRIENPGELLCRRRGNRPFEQQPYKLIIPRPRRTHPLLHLKFGCFVNSLLGSEDPFKPVFLNIAEIMLGPVVELLLPVAAPLSTLGPLATVGRPLLAAACHC